jgi:uncharacterized protein (TIGR01777 family)
VFQGADMKILITGATGLVGTRLIERLLEEGHDDIRILTTNINKAQGKIPFPVDIKHWDPVNNSIDQTALENVDTIIHLAGENVADGRWSKKRKDNIYNSRINGTNLLIEQIKKSSTIPKKFISSSAVGIYERGFLKKVCEDWEGALFQNQIPEMSCHAVRTGVVLSSEGGALTKMLPPFLAGAGGRLGSGRQFMSWIHIDDLVDLYLYIMNNDSSIETYDGVSPETVTNSEFTKVLGKVISRPTIAPVPGFVLKLLFGEMSQILLEGKSVSPQSTLKSGFTFKYPKLNDALENLLHYQNNGEVLFKNYQWVNSPKTNVFSFFSNEMNLEKITPSFLNFKVLGKSTEALDEGTLIDYKLNIHGVPVKWKTRINHFHENESFIDEQLKGPYSKWVHYHEFKTLRNGTLIKDKVIYKVPFGSLGNLLVGWLVKKDVRNIFNFRNKVIKATF